MRKRKKDNKQGNLMFILAVLVVGATRRQLCAVILSVIFWWMYGHLRDLLRLVSLSSSPPNTQILSSLALYSGVFGTEGIRSYMKEMGRELSSVTEFVSCFLKQFQLAMDRVVSIPHTTNSVPGKNGSVLMLIVLS